MSDSYEQQDEELKSALRQIYDNIEIPDSMNSWLQVQKRLEKRKRILHWKRRMKIATSIVVVSFTLNLVINMSPITAYSHISGLFKRIQQDVIAFFHEKPDHHQSETKTPPPSDRVTFSNSDSQMVEVTLEEAQSKVSFHLLVPTEIPEGFQMETIRLFSPNGKNYYNNVQFEYVNANNEVFNIIQQKIEGESAGIKVEMTTGSGEYKDVFINGHAAILMTPMEGNTNLEWLTDDRILVRISGRLGESEILKLGSSLK